MIEILFGIFVVGFPVLIIVLLIVWLLYKEKDDKKKHPEDYIAKYREKEKK